MAGNSGDSPASASVPTISDNTTWSEVTETTVTASTMAKWADLKEQCEPLMIIARRTTPFLTGTRSCTMSMAIPK